MPVYRFQHERAALRRHEVYPAAGLLLQATRPVPGRLTGCNPHADRAGDHDLQADQHERLVNADDIRQPPQ